MKREENCPYCAKPMARGVIHGDRYRLKWIPEEKDKGLVFQLFSKGIKLGYSLDSYYCKSCDKIIVDNKSRKYTF